MPLVIMLVSALAVIALVKHGLVPGIDRLSAALGWSLKARGKATGYATSVPELVTLVAAGLSGVWEAGLWNIASSNLINVGLATTVVIAYRRTRDVFCRRYAKELAFAAIGIAAPLLLMQLGLDTHVAVIPCLLVLFVAYLMLDKNDGDAPDGLASGGDASAALGLTLIVGSLGLIIVAGNILGSATRDVVMQMGVPAIAAGWILGVVTSLPEAVTFFTAFSTDRVGSEASGPAEQMQELLDNLAASNMSNSGLIYPLGLALFLATTGIL